MNIKEGDNIKTYKIFTSGKMGGLSYEEQMKWRKNLEKAIKLRCNKNIIFVHPPMYYQYGNEKNEREAKEWEINQLKDSDIIVVNLTTIADSIGTHIELGIVEAMNEFGYKHIHVIGIGNPNTNHPWIQMGLLKQVDTIDEAADYILSYLLL